VAQGKEELLNMKVSYRLVILFGSLVMLAISVFFFGLLMGQDPLRIGEFLVAKAGTEGLKLLLFVVFFILFLLLAMAGLHTKQPLRAIIHETALGEVRVAFSAVQSLALRSVKKIRGVREAEVDVQADVDGLNFEVEIVCSPDLNIPQLVQEIRTKLAEYIRETVGIPVNNSTVTVARIAVEPRARVE